MLSLAAVRARLVTGERVTQSEHGFNPNYQRHVACYRHAAAHLPPGRVLDLGAGIGHSFDELAPRETVGLDTDADALAGQSRETVVADMRAIPFPDGAFASVLGVHSIEHVPDAERVLAEVVRVLAEDGVCMLFTPNRLTFARPNEIIDPYHFREYDAEELRALCAPWFEEVTVLGLFASGVFNELKAEQSARLNRILARDPLRLRRWLPLSIKRLAYDYLHTRARRNTDPRAAAVNADDFELRDTRLADAIDVVAIARRGRKQR
jgi:SAM-dependent methyltransferase